jgi:hypothetical protein
VSGFSYPAALPGAQPGSFAPRQRRAASSIDGPLQQRARQRDAAGMTSQYTYTFTPEELEIWRGWFRDTLLDGRRWFDHALPGRGGIVPRVVRYLDVQQQLLGVGIYRVAVRLEQRGASLAPQDEPATPPLGFNTLTANVTSGVTYSNNNKTVSHQIGNSTYLTVAVHRPRFQGKYYWEVTCNTLGLVSEFGWACKAAIPINSSIISTPNNTNDVLPPYEYGYFHLYVPDGSTNATGHGIGPTITPNGSAHTYMFAVDFVNSPGGSKVYFGVDGVWTGNPSAGTGGVTGVTLGPGSPAISSRGDFGAASSTVRLITADLSYTCPTGFIPWGDPDSVDNDA